MESLRISQFLSLQGSMSQQYQSGTEHLEGSKRAAGHQSISEAQSSSSISEGIPQQRDEWTGQQE